MPTICNEAGFRFVIYPNDHTPSHVHIVRNSGNQAGMKVDIKSLTILSGSSNFKQQEKTKIVDIIRQNQSDFLEKWEKIHG